MSSWEAVGDVHGKRIWISRSAIGNKTSTVSRNVTVDYEGPRALHLLVCIYGILRRFQFANQTHLPRPTVARLNMQHSIVVRR